MEVMKSWLPFFLLFLPSLFAADDRPHVLVFLVDDLGVMDTELRHADGSAFYETPNLRKLAARGMTFANGYCAHPRCVPSRYALMTGRFPCHDKMNATSAEAAIAKRKTIGEAFQENGYATLYAGKWHLGKTEDGWPHKQGYDTNIGGCHAGGPGSYFFPFHVTRAGVASKYGPMFGLEDGEKGEHLTDRLTRDTAAWIRSRVADSDKQADKQTDKPFFAVLAHYAVHTPIEGKPDETAAFTAKVKHMPGGDAPAYAEVDGLTKQRCDNAAYASMVKTMDESLGAMLALLDELSIADNTVIAFTSDHGGLSNRGLKSKRDLATSNLPYRAGKGHLYEGGLRVPFVIAHPKRIKAGSRSETVAVGTDLYPTLLDIAGLKLETSEHTDGISLLPSLEGEDQVRKRPLIYHSPLPRPDQTGDAAASVIRVKDLKLVKNYFPESLELYDLAVDPFETTNLAGARADEAKKMQARLETILTRWGAMPPRKHWKDKTVTAPLSKNQQGAKDGAAKPAAARNILFLAVDDLKPTLGCYGDVLAKTPYIDAIAARGIVFENAHCQWPVCGPSRASLMTSLRPEASGVMNLKTSMRAKNPDVVSLPQHFAEHGFTTAGCGKIYDPRCVDDKKTNDAPSWTIPFRHYKLSAVTEPDGKELAARAPDVADEATADGQIRVAGVKLMRELAAKPDQPFFLAVGFKKPHLAFVAPKRYWDLHDRAAFEQPLRARSITGGSGYSLHDSEELRSYGGVPQTGPIPAALEAELRHGYYACTSFIDAQIGVLLNELDTLGLAENTAIVLWGDHGFHLGDHGIWGKHTPLEGATRSPLIFAGPKGTTGLPAGTRSSAPVEFTDIYPTLTELAGVPARSDIQGRNLLPLWRGEVDSVRGGALSLFSRKGAFGYSFRTRQHRYIEWVTKSGETVARDLFDYETDPTESRSLAGDPAQAELMERLAKMMRSEAAGCDRLMNNSESARP